MCGGIDSAGAGFTSLWGSRRKTGGPSSVKIREIDRPGVLRFRRETKAHEKSGAASILQDYGISVRDEPKHMRNRDLCDTSHVFLLVPTKRWTGKVKN